MQSAQRTSRCRCWVNSGLYVVVDGRSVCCLLTLLQLEPLEPLAHSRGFCLQCVCYESSSCDPQYCSTQLPLSTTAALHVFPSTRPA